MKVYIVEVENEGIVGVFDSFEKAYKCLTLDFDMIRNEYGEYVYKVNDPFPSAWISCFEVE